MRIIHINNIANVGPSYIEGLLDLGMEADFYPIQIYFGQRPILIKLFSLHLRVMEWIKAIRQIRKGRYDVVHIHYASMGVIGLLSGQDYYIHCHGTDVRVGLKKWFYRMWLLPILNSARRVFYVTPDLKEVLGSVRKDAVFMPNPINLDVFSAEPKSPKNNPGCRLLLFSKIDEEKKGTQIAMQALLEVHRLYPDLKVSAIAFGKDYPKYSAWDWIDFIPYFDHSKLSEFLGQFDLIVGQFSYGVLGVSELEAMACGKPVVCFFDFPEAYPEYPPVLSTREPSQVAKNITRLIEDLDYRMELGSQARAWIERNHEYHRVSEKLLMIYQDDLCLDSK